MCLILEARSPASSRPVFENAAREAAVAGLQIVVEPPSRLPWLRGRAARATISENGGCACSLLTENADWNAETWDMRREVLESVATTLEILSTLGPNETVIEALWIGDDVRETVHVSSKEIGELARMSRIGTHSRYLIVHGSSFVP